MLTLDDLRKAQKMLADAIAALERVERLEPLVDALRPPADSLSMARPLPVVEVQPTSNPPVQTGAPPAPPSNPLVCQQCGAPITPKTGRGGLQKRFCSAACRVAASDARRGPRSKPAGASPAADKAPGAPWGTAPGPVARSGAADGTVERHSEPGWRNGTEPSIEALCQAPAIDREAERERARWK